MFLIGFQLISSPLRILNDFVKLVIFISCDNFFQIFELALTCFVRVEILFIMDQLIKLRRDFLFDDIIDLLDFELLLFEMVLGLLTFLLVKTCTCCFFY